jgi:hypothetical protein
MKTNLFLLRAVTALVLATSTSLVTAQSPRPPSGGNGRPPVQLPSGGTVSLPGGEPSGGTVTIPLPQPSGGAVSLPDSSSPGLVVSVPGSRPVSGTVTIPTPRPSGGTVSLPGGHRPAPPKPGVKVSERLSKLPANASMDPLPGGPASKYIGETEKALARQPVRSKK